MQRSIALAGAVTLVLLADVAAARQPEWVGKRREEISARFLRGNGSWKAAGERHRPPQRWSLELERGDDGTITGSVIVDDSPLLVRGRVRGKIQGRQVSGSIVDPGGKHAARFWGTIRGETLRGTYTDRTGESGAWVWDGRLPD